jgi:hypothetical protein
LASAVRLMVILTRGVYRAIPRFFAIALAEVTTPLATGPDPPSFSLAKTNIVSPLATRAFARVLIKGELAGALHAPTPSGTRSPRF